MYMPFLYSNKSLLRFMNRLRINPSKYRGIQDTNRVLLLV